MTRQTNNDIDAAFVALEDDIATLVFILTNEEVTPEKIAFVAGNGFTDEESRGQCYNTFYGRKLRLFIIG